MVGQAVAVADDLVDHIGFGCVKRHRMVANVLRGVENAVRQGAVELKERHQPGRRHVLEASKWPEHLVHLDELRNVILGKLESLLALQVRGAGKTLVQAVQLGADDAPDLLLGVGVGRDGGECRAANPWLARPGRCVEPGTPGRRHLGGCHPGGR